MAERYFSRDEVEALIPKLAELVERLQSAHAEGGERRERLKAEHQRLTLAGGGVLDKAQWRADTAGAERATKRAQKALEDIQAIGGEPKDVGLGLIDFPHLRDGRVVNLCWKQGETVIRFWHGLDEGYTARKPL